MAKPKGAIMGDLKLKHPSEDWQLKPCSVGRAAKFVNCPDNLPDIDPIPDHDKLPDKSDAGTKYNLRRKHQRTHKARFIRKERKCLQNKKKNLKDIIQMQIKN